MRARQRPSGPRVLAWAWSPLSPGLPGPFPGEDAGSRSALGAFTQPSCPARRHRRCALVFPHIFDLFLKSFINHCRCLPAYESAGLPLHPGPGLALRGRDPHIVAVFICYTGLLEVRVPHPLISQGGAQDVAHAGQPFSCATTFLF